MREQLNAWFTKQTNYYLDFARIGNLFLENHQYSRKELLQRGGILFSGVTGGYAASQYLPELVGGSSKFWLISGSIASWAVAHTVVILPLILKRYEMSQKCSEIVQKIEDKINNLESKVNGLRKKPQGMKVTIISEHTRGYQDTDNSREIKNLENRIELAERVGEVSTHFSELSFDDGKSGNASKTWGRRARLLANAYSQFKNDLKAIKSNPDCFNEKKTFWIREKHELENVFSSSKPSNVLKNS